MMRYQYLLIVLGVILFAACSSEENTLSAGSNIPVEFGTYVGRTTSATRAGTIGAMNLAKLRQTGFGIFCQHQDKSDFEYSKSFDFLFNQSVYSISKTNKMSRAGGLKFLFFSLFLKKRRLI